MKKNIGSIDKIIRVFVALVLGALYFTGTVSGIAGIIFLLVAGVFLITSVASWCPIYSSFGLSTFKSKAQKTNN